MDLLGIARLHPYVTPKLSIKKTKVSKRNKAPSLSFYKSIYFLLLFGLYAEAEIQSVVYHCLPRGTCIRKLGSSLAPLDCYCIPLTPKDTAHLTVTSLVLCHLNFSYLLCQSLKRMGYQLNYLNIEIRIKISIGSVCLQFNVPVKFKLFSQSTKKYRILGQYARMM